MFTRTAMNEGLFKHINTKEQPDTVLSLEALHKMADIEPFPRVPELCIEAGISECEIASHVVNKIQAVLSQVQTSSSTGHLSNDLLFVGKCFHAFRAEPEKYGEYLKAIETFSSLQKDSFRGVTLSSYQRAIWKGWVTRSIDNLFPREILIEPLERSAFRPKLLQAVRPRFFVLDQHDPLYSWSFLKNTKESKIYITNRVRSDIESLKQHTSRYVFHSTSSSLLPGLAKYKEFKSRNELHALGENVFSGEGSDVDPRVYVSNYFNHGAQYSHVCWFDEYPITFIFSREEVRPLEESFAPDYGISLGHRVPIEYVKEVLVPARNMELAEVWVKENIPHAKVHSLEAYAVT